MARLEKRIGDLEQEAIESAKEPVVLAFLSGPKGGAERLRCGDLESSETESYEDFIARAKANYRRGGVLVVLSDGWRNRAETASEGPTS